MTPFGEQPTTAAPLHDDRVVLHADPTRLKGLGHPIRVAILDELSNHGSATASILGERLGESSGATSYHLRQLERHGFVEEDSARGHGRERWWRRRSGQIDVAPEDMGGDPARLEAAALVVGQFASVRAHHLDAFLRRGLSDLGVKWLEAASVANTSLDLTVDELAEFSGSIAQAIEGLATRVRDRTRPDGAQTVVIEFNAFPLV